MEEQSIQTITKVYTKLQ